MKKNPTFGKSKMVSLQQELFDSESPEQAPAPEPPLMKPTPKQMHPRAMVTASSSAFWRHHYSQD